MTTTWTLGSCDPVGWILGRRVSVPTRSLSECTRRSSAGAVYAVDMMAPRLIASTTISPAMSSLTVVRRVVRRQPATAPTRISAARPVTTVSQMK